MRHFAIYAQQWPARLASQAVGPVTRDDLETSSRRPAQKSLPAVEQKHASGGEERPAKRRKIEQAPVVEMSAKAKELLMPPKRKRGRPRKYPLPEEEAPKRKRGRPRKTSPPRPPPPKPRAATPVIKVVTPRTSSPARSRRDPASPSSSRGHLKPKSLAVQLQPRDSNGRFGKKANTNGRFVRKKVNTIRSSATRTQRALQRTKVKRWLGDTAKGPTPLANGKRRTSIVPDDSPRPSKKLRSGLHLGDGDEDPVPPNPSGSSSSRFKGINGSLLCRPNPTNFARRTWAPPFGEDSSPEDEDAESSLRTLESESNGPVTPEDHTPLPILGVDQFLFKEKPVDIKHEDVAPHRPMPRPLAHGISTILTFKPSPVNFARRRWSSTIKSPLELGSGTRRSQRLRPRSSLPGEDNLSLAPSHSHVPSALSTRTILAGRSVSLQKSTETNPAPRTVSEAASENVRTDSQVV
jgi:histone-lysine N-methyltransferase SUV420H